MYYGGTSQETKEQRKLTIIETYVLFSSMFSDLGGMHGGRNLGSLLQMRRAPNPHLLSWVSFWNSLKNFWNYKNIFICNVFCFPYHKGNFEQKQIVTLVWIRFENNFHVHLGWFLTSLEYWRIWLKFSEKQAKLLIRASIFFQLTWIQRKSQVVMQLWQWRIEAQLLGFWLQYRMGL